MTPEIYMKFKSQCPWTKFYSDTAMLIIRLHIVCGYFPAMMAEVTCERDHVSTKPQIFTVWPFPFQKKFADLDDLAFGWLLL